jgi:hypothetical protein
MKLDELAVGLEVEAKLPLLPAKWRLATIQSINSADGTVNVAMKTPLHGVREMWYRFTDLRPASKR